MIATIVRLRVPMRRQRNRTVRSIRPWILALGVLIADTAAAADDIAKLAWLAGCWSSASAEAGSGEQWMPPAGGTMFGTNRTVKQGRTVEFEFMQLRTLGDGRLTFIAQPSGQPPSEFPLLRLSDIEAVFENLQHDFPQRVIYARHGDAGLRARIEGMREGKLHSVEFPMLKVDCNSWIDDTAK